MEPALTRVPPLVAALAEGLRQYLGKPFAFFGHSMGAVLGFELARLLRDQGLPQPVRLFVSAHRAPQLPDARPPLHDLPEPELVQALRRLKGTPEEILRHAELLELMLPLLRADFAVAETYTYVAAAPLRCPISAFGGDADAEVGCDQLAAWSAQTQDGFRLRMLPGDHFFLVSARPALLQAIGEALDEDLDEGLGEDLVERSGETNRASSDSTTRGDHAEP
jgi:medium-chain acyl-[acyl-carrier-protein] hydrolase